MIKIVFMGTPQFAVESLSRIIDSGFFVPAVVTVPDKPAGRGLKLQPSAVKQFATEHNIPVLQPANLNSQEFIDKLKAIAPDIIAVVAFRKLPKAVWSIAKRGTFNVHSSLLPQYRGAAPMNHAIINGETKTGITTFLLDEEMDTGKIIFQSELAILPEDTFLEVHDKMMILGADLAVKTIEALISGDYTPIDQSALLSNSNTVIHNAPKIHKEDCLIDWNDTAEDIHNKIRGLSPIPSAFTQIILDENNSLSVKIFSSEFSVGSTDGKFPGDIVSDGKTYFGMVASDGIVYFKEVQAAGKKRMFIADFLRGFRMSASH